MTNNGAADSIEHGPHANQESQDLAVCRERVTALQEQLLRMTADYENFKKRTERDKRSWIKTAQSALLLDFLAIADNLERALSSVSAMAENSDCKVLVDGITMTVASFAKLLKKYGVTEMASSAEFDPKFHEAIVQVEAPEGVSSGAIVLVLEKGYLIDDEVLRPAKVSVAR